MRDADGLKEGKLQSLGKRLPGQETAHLTPVVGRLLETLIRDEITDIWRNKLASLVRKGCLRSWVEFVPGDGAEGRTAEDLASFWSSRVSNSSRSEA